VIQLYLTTLARVYDPHSDYLGHAQLEQFAIGMNLSLFGIGAELRSEDGYCSINRLLPGGPATKSNKIKEKDRIVAVGQSNQPPVDVVDMNLSKAVQLIRGPKGTEVRLTIIPAGADMSVRKEVTLIRDEIPLEDMAAKAKLIDLPDGNGGTNRMGVIDLPSFYASFDVSSSRGRSESKSTSADVIRLVNKLKQENIKGLILDLRRNGGGSLEEAIRLTGLFIKEGPVVQIKSFDGDLQEDSDNDPSVLYDGPLIVLTSRFSASASEIVAGALQDYGRALLVGDQATHGKGTVQSVNPLKPYVQLPDKSATNDPGALKLTIKKFYRASGASTQLKGVTPDIVLPSIFNEAKDFGEESLDNALAYDTLPSAKFEPVNRVAPYLEELRKRSSGRIATDKDFDYIRQDIAHYKKTQADKTISLNEQTRLKEKDEADARMKARDQERLTRKEPSEKIYEITLKNAVLPGLPAPVAKTNALAKAAMQGSGGTNETAATPIPAHPRLENSADDEEEKPPAVDATMIEAEHILVDYLELLSKRGQVAGK
jgi:carboxyl-terminal processing protease